MTHYHAILSTVRDAAAEVAHRVQRNPVLVGAAALWGYNALTSGHPVTLADVVIVGVGVLVRSQVVPASEVEAIAHSVEGAVENVAKAAETPPSA